MKRFVSAVMIAVTICLSAGQAAYAQQDASGCITGNVPIYHADGRYIDGRVRMCSYSEVYDLTPAPNQIRPGEQLFVTARAERSQRNGFVRARPNYPYVIHDAETEAFHMMYVNSQRGLRWSTVARTLPFLPTEVYYQGREEGFPRYSYGRPVLIPSRRRQAYPINENSVIFSIGGVGFMSPDALRGMLTAPADPGYVEVMFFQRNENPVVFRRAFVPTFNRADVNAEFQQIIRGRSIFADDDMSDDLSNLGTALASLVGMWVIYQAYYRSGLARSLEPDCDAFSTVCWRDPLLDLID